MILNVALDLPEDGAYLRIARRLGRTLLEDLGVVGADIDDVEFVVGELCTNVIRHAKSSEGRFLVTLQYYADAVAITVEDQGAGFSFKDVEEVGTVRPDMDGTERLGGFGLDLVRQLADHLEFRRTDESGMAVRADINLHYKTQAGAENAAALDKGGGGEISIKTG